MSKLIYEKKYPKTDFDELKAKSDDSDDQKSEMLPPKEYFAKIEQNTTYFPIPGRIAGKEAFIKTAIAIGELYEFDTKIYECKSHVSVWLSLDYGGGMLSGLKHIFQLSDDFDFLVGVEGREFTIICDYYTHEVWLNGRKTAPIQ